MPSKTKTRILDYSKTIWHRWEQGGTSETTYNSWVNGSDTITYETGPEWLSNHRNWKTCTHNRSGVLRYTYAGGAYAQYDLYDGHVIGDPMSFMGTTGRVRQTRDIPPRDSAAIEECYQKAMDELDLNTRESVMIYSGVLQAVPLVGGCFKFVSLMNQLGRKLSRGLRKQPFTTVLKTAISLDFIDRFVLRPTLDDARRFLDAHNYVVRTMQTMYERQNAVGGVSIDGETSTAASVRSGTSANNIVNGVRLEYAFEERALVNTKAFLLVDVNYQTRAVDPIKLWAARCGITRPLDSAWDLVPFSFVIDYFTRAGDFVAGIGDHLANQEALEGKVTNLRGMWLTQYRADNGYSNGIRFTPSTVIRSDWYPRGFTPDATAASCTAENSVFDRIPIPNPFSRTSIWDDPFFRLDLSPTRLRTLAELIIQARVR